jgi:hypothetical protein
MTPSEAGLDQRHGADERIVRIINLENTDQALIAISILMFSSYCSD